MSEPKWEPVFGEDTKRIFALTHRMRVNGGWLYRVITQTGVALQFVPDPPVEPA